VLSAPRDFANAYSLQMSDNVESRLLNLGQVNTSHGFSPNDPVNNEVISFYNRVLIDGRYVYEWTQNPQQVAQLLNISVSPTAINRIDSMNINSLVDAQLLLKPNDFGLTTPNALVAIILVIVLVFIPSCLTYNIQELVVDPNTQNKV
jgi:hypothetical protein